MPNLKGQHTMTYTEAKQIVNALGMRITKTEYDEYRVALANNSEASAYYATDLDDAVGTARAMHARRAIHRIEACVTLLDAIRPGDKVTISNHLGQHRTGRALFMGTHGWVLNMGGRYGTPGVATVRNVVRVMKGSK
jgi:hypothetical protein